MKIPLKVIFLAGGAGVVAVGGRPVLKPHVDALPLAIAGLVDPAYPRIERIEAADVLDLVAEASQSGKPSIQLVSNALCPRTASMLAEFDALARTLREKRGFTVQTFIAEPKRDVDPHAHLRSRGVRGMTYWVVGPNAFNDAHTNIGWMGEPGYTPFIIVRDANGRVVRQLHSVSGGEMSGLIAAAARASR